MCKKSRLFFFFICASIFLYIYSKFQWFCLCNIFLNVCFLFVCLFVCLFFVCILSVCFVCFLFFLFFYLNQNLKSYDMLCP